VRDFNFFELHLRKTKAIEKRRLIIFSSTIFLIVAIVAFPLINFLQERAIRKDIAQMKSILAKPENQELINRVNQKKIAVDEMNKQLPLVEGSHKAIQQTKYIDEYLIEMITNAIPRNLIFQSLVVNQGNVSIFGQTNDKSAVAEFVHNLRLLNRFEEIFVPVITLREDGSFDFSIVFKVKGVMSDEVK